VVYHHHAQTHPWLKQMGERRPANVVIVALTNKMARQIWAVLAKEQAFQPGHISVRPA
jgi:hypothetical protein